MALPLPRTVADVGPGGGIVTALGGMNALAKQALENKYYGPLAQADVASKTAYAQYTPAQILANVLSNPLAVQNMDKNTFNNLMNRYGQLVNNPPSIQSMMPQSNNTGLLNRAANAIGGLFGLGNSDQSNPNPMRQMSMQQGMGPQNTQPQNVASTSNDQNYYSSQDQGGANTASDQEAQEIIDRRTGSPTLPSTHVGRLASDMGYGQTKFGGINPSSVPTAQAAALTSTATGEASAQVEQQKLMESNDIAAANEAVQQKQLLTKARDLHGKIPQWQRGKIFGNITPDILTGSEATELDTTMQNIVASVKKQQDTGNAGVAGIELATASKPNRSMPDGAFNHLVDYNDGMNDRILEKPAFNKAFFDQGYTPAQVATMWLYYQTKKPFYDSEHHVKDEANLNTWDKFYSTQSRRDAAFSPSADKDISKVMGKKALNSVNSNQQYDEAPNVGKNQIALEGGLIVPKSFASKEAFNAWFSEQPKSTQLAYRQHLQGKQ